MPELPEVEVVRRGLAEHAAGRTVGAVEVLHPRAVRRHPGGAADFAAAMRGMRVLSAQRRGKYLWLPLAAPGAGPDDGQPAASLLAHLGMSGQFLVGDPARPLSGHDRVRFAFDDDGPDLRFADQRTFGHVMCALGDDSPPALISHIAPDPFESAYDEQAVTARLKQRRGSVKTALLDQALISGVGNIYADEALWRAEIHGARPAASLRPAEAAALLAAVRSVMGEALAAGGTSFDQLYVHVNGESGYFGRSLAVYGREGEPCPRCGMPVRRDPFANRSSYTCPRCQRGPDSGPVRAQRRPVRRPG